ncbi:MAG: hypothetical protein HUJ30_09220 [Gammaproteobacteria bacterium]|nr:hypothetical protein [Gammaproteobacteria bacterium]
MSDNNINDFLLDQELDGNDSAASELPDDIDAILDAVEEEDLQSAEEQAEAIIDEASLLDEDVAYDDDHKLDEPETLTEPDLDAEINIADEAAAADILTVEEPSTTSPSMDSMDDDIPVISDIVDPSAPSPSSASLDDDLMFQIMSKIQSVVEQSLQKELNQITKTLTDNVLEDVKLELPAIISATLKKAK